MDSAGRRATAALWSLNGIGPKTMAKLEGSFGPLAKLLEVPVSSWRGAAWLTAQGRASLATVGRLADVADTLERTLRRLGHRAVFPGDAQWPERLTADLSPVLFLMGPGAGAPRRRVAVVGTRHPDPGVRDRVRRLAAEVVGCGLVVVSGAAEGIDQAAHSGALSAGGETWAFLGCAIDQMDDAQKVLLVPFRDRGGSFFSQFPPGTRSDRSTFRRRNPLISGSSDVVLVARAPIRSGALITADAAWAQGRPLLAIPGDPWNPVAAGTNELLRSRRARVCLSAQDLVAAAGLDGVLSPSPAEPLPREPVSELAQVVLEVLTRHPADLDQLVEKCRLDSGRVSACLVELQLAGYVVQKAGGRFEKS